MPVPPRNSRKAAPEKPAPRRRRATPTAGPRSLRGQNVVGGIHAQDNAQVRVSQRIYTQLSEDEQQRRKQESELRALRDAIRQKLKDLKRLAGAPMPEAGNPYLFVQPFDTGDAGRFFGRKEVVRELVARLQQNRTTFLNGVGKTSLLQAGIVPALLAKGHLPLVVQASAEPLSTSIKKQLLPNIEAMDFLKSMALAEFVRRVTDNLPSKELYLLIDQFEAVAEQPESFRAAFKEDWELCVSGIAPEAHWLFTVTGSTYPLKMFSDRVAVNSNLVTVEPLEPEQARDAIRGPAALRGIQVDDAVLSAIVAQLGRPAVDPAQLELVCYMLAGGTGPLVQQWTMDYYMAQGQADGILRAYLDRTISDFDPAERDPAWQLLAMVTDARESATSEEELIQRMKTLDVSEETTRRALADLQESHLVQYATAYKLASDSLLPRIQEWRERRAALEQAQEEFLRQLRSIGGSALRGLLGGGLGFMLAYWVLPYVEREPITNTPRFFQLYFFNLSLRAMVGAFAGFALILSIDFILATFGAERKWLRLPAAVLAGALSFSLALLFHTILRISGTQQLLALANAGLEGLLWGVAAGAGALWVSTSTRQWWLKLLAVSAGCGAVLALADAVLHGLSVTAPLYVVFLAGVLFPLFVIGSANLGGPRATKVWTP